MSYPAPDSEVDPTAEEPLAGSDLRKSAQNTAARLNEIAIIPRHLSAFHRDHSLAEVIADKSDNLTEEACVFHGMIIASVINIRDVHTPLLVRGVACFIISVPILRYTSLSEPSLELACFFLTAGCTAGVHSRLHSWPSRFLKVHFAPVPRKRNHYDTLLKRNPDR